jgi:hypothetical protein
MIETLRNSAWGNCRLYFGNASPFPMQQELKGVSAQHKAFGYVWIGYWFTANIGDRF